MPIILNWLGCEGVRFVKTLTHSEKEKCKSSSVLCEVLSEKFKPQHNETILSHCKLESSEEWMGDLQVRQMSVNTKRQRLKEQFIARINDMLIEIIKELKDQENSK